MSSCMRTPTKWVEGITNNIEKEAWSYFLYWILSVLDLATNIKPLMWPKEIRIFNYFTISSKSLALSFFLFSHSQSVAFYSCAYHLMFISSCCGSGISSQKQEVQAVSCFCQWRKPFSEDFSFCFIWPELILWLLVAAREMGKGMW